MIVTLNLDNHFCKVEKEEGDPHFSNSGWTYAESIFLYHVKRELIKQGHDVIKKRMWKDGHMTDDTNQYIRSRNVKDPEAFYVYNSNCAIWDAGIKFNDTGMVLLYAEKIND